jgi:4-diphosphocytidyl-2-C-methyl-D-erythritol kinase
MASRDVFAALYCHGLAANKGSSRGQDHSLFERLPSPGHLGCPEFAAMLADLGNDLEQSAIKLQPAIADVLAALRGLSGCRLARMSGSGATCFGLFDSRRRAAAAAQELRAAHPDWWVRATVLA